MTEMLTPERKWAAFQGFRPGERIDNLRQAAMGASALCLLVAGAAWLASHEHAPVMLDFVGP
jgi:hypothetical protein